MEGLKSPQGRLEQFCRQSSALLSWVLSQAVLDGRFGPCRKRGSRWVLLVWERAEVPVPSEAHCPAVAGSCLHPCIPVSLRKATASVYPCECVTWHVLTETCALRALWKLVSQPASPGLLWQCLTLKNQSCLYLWLFVSTAAAKGVRTGHFGRWLALFPLQTQPLVWLKQDCRWNLVSQTSFMSLPSE